jgi:hypothetical protein
LPCNFVNDFTKRWAGGFLFCLSAQGCRTCFCQLWSSLVWNCRLFFLFVTRRGQLFSIWSSFLSTLGLKVQLI